MRARYAAYALGKTRFVMETTATQRPDTEVWRAEIQRFTDNTSFVSLDILETEDGPTEAWVTFRAGLEQGGQDASFTERSRFVRRDRWYYADGERRD